MSKIRIMLFVLVALISASAFAETNDTRYVTDRLLLTMYALPSPSAEVITRLKSGDVLTEVERQGRFTKVTTDSGKTGWVKQVFLVTKKPAVLIVRQAEKDVARIQLKMNKLESSKNSPAKLLAQIKTLESKIEVQASSLKAAMNNEQQLTTENATIKKAQAGEQSSSMMVWALFLILGLLIGFFAGYKVLEIKVKKRFCGLKVW